MCVFWAFYCSCFVCFFSLLFYVYKLVFCCLFAFELVLLLGLEGLYLGCGHFVVEGLVGLSAWIPFACFLEVCFLLVKLLQDVCVDESLMGVFPCVS